MYILVDIALLIITNGNPLEHIWLRLLQTEKWKLRTGKYILKIFMNL